MTKKELMATGLRVQPSHDKTQMRVEFSDDAGNIVAAIIPAEAAPLLLRQVHDGIVSTQQATSVTPASMSQLMLGQQFHLDGHTVRRQQDGGIVLTAFLRIENRVVTLPMEFSEEEARDIAARSLGLK